MVCDFLGVDASQGGRASLRKLSPAANDFIEGYAELAARLPELVDSASRAPAPVAVLDATESRVFLLHRARMRLLRADFRAALEDALAALEAPPDWGVETCDWACATIADLLDRLGDRDLAGSVARTLELRFGAEPAARQLASRIRARLRDGV